MVRSARPISRPLPTAICTTSFLFGGPEHIRPASCFGSQYIWVFGFTSLGLGHSSSASSLFPRNGHSSPMPHELRLRFDLISSLLFHRHLLLAAPHGAFNLSVRPRLILGFCSPSPFRSRSEGSARIFISLRQLLALRSSFQILCA